MELWGKIQKLEKQLEKKPKKTWQNASLSPAQGFKANSDLAPFPKELSGNGFKNNFKAMTSRNIGSNLEIPEKFQPKDRRE